MSMMIEIQCLYQWEGKLQKSPFRLTKVATLQHLHAKRLESTWLLWKLQKPRWASNLAFNAAAWWLGWHVSPRHAACQIEGVCSSSLKTNQVTSLCFSSICSASLFFIKLLFIWINVIYVSCCILNHAKKVVCQRAPWWSRACSPVTGDLSISGRPGDAWNQRTWIHQLQPRKSDWNKSKPLVSSQCIRPCSQRANQQGDLPSVAWLRTSCLSG